MNYNVYIVRDHEHAVLQSLQQYTYLGRMFSTPDSIVHAYRIEKSQQNEFLARTDHFRRASMVTVVLRGDDLRDQKETIFFCDSCGFFTSYKQGTSVLAEPHSHCGKPMRFFLSLTKREIETCYERKEILLYRSVDETFFAAGWYEVVLRNTEDDYIELSFIGHEPICAQLHYDEHMRGHLRRKNDEL